jgi:hypothetical protein
VTSTSQEILDGILTKPIREALDECAVTNEIEIAEHHLDYLANWAAEAARSALLAKGGVSTRWHVVRGAPLIPQSDEEYAYTVFELRLTEPQVPDA